MMFGDSKHFVLLEVAVLAFMLITGGLMALVGSALILYDELLGFVPLFLGAVLIFVSLGWPTMPARANVLVASVTTTGSSITVNTVTNDGDTYNDVACTSSPKVDCAALTRGDQIVIKRIGNSSKYTVASVQE